MEEKKLKDIFDQATKMVQAVPKNLQPVAFNRAMDILLDSPAAI